MGRGVAKDGDGRGKMTGKTRKGWQRGGGETRKERICKGEDEFGN